jgi:hypothetical protein
LPGGLSISSLCVISGTPTTIQTASNYTITASNSRGSTTASISISVQSPNNYIVSMPTGLLKTGQTTSYVAGDDGAYKKGVARTFTSGGSTGLIWQKCTRGQSLTDCSGEPIYSSYLDAVNYCNNLNLSGLTWRIPNINEITLLLDHEQNTAPLINKNIFQSTVPNRYWSKYLDIKFAVAFDIESILGVDPNYAFLTRCISGNEQPTSNFINNNNGTATDLNSGLIWQKCYGTQTSLDCVNSSSTYNWYDAINYCENLSLAGRTDWRLPNINELNSILERYNKPTINKNIFPNTQGFHYWTSTTNPLNINTALQVVFDYGGLVGSENKTSSAFLRCLAGP